MSLWQYQVKAEPVFTGSERTSPDKYNPQDYYPRRSFARNAAIAAVVLAANTAFAFVPTPPSEIVTVDKWHPEISRPLWDARRTQYLNPASVLGDIPRAESVSIDRWHPVIEQPRRSVVRPIFESGVNNPYPIPNVVTTVPFDWLIQNAEPFRSKPRVIVEGSSFVYPVVAAVTPFDWQIQQPVPVRSRPSIRIAEQAFQLATFGESVSIDKWQTLDNLPRWDVKRTQARFPYLFFIPPTPEIVTSEKWEPQLRYRLWGPARRDYLYNGVGVELPQPNAVFVDSWIPAQVYQRPLVVPLYWIFPYGEIHLIISGVHLPCILQANATLIQPVGYCAEEIACE